MKNNIVFIIFDSCRYDNFKNAKTPNIDRLGKTEKRYTYAGWTAPSHAVFLTGMMPHKSPKRVYASEVYKDDFVQWSHRTNIKDIGFGNFVPELSLPAYLKSKGYRAHAYVSMPVLNPATIYSKHFDIYKLMPKHNDFNAIIDKLTFIKSKPTFYFLNIGETHYPYALPTDGPNDLPRISGAHGVFKHLDDFVIDGKLTKTNKLGKFFTTEKLHELKLKQKKECGIFGWLIQKTL